MSHQPTPTKIRRCFSLLAPLVALLPLAASAESYVFDANFAAGQNTVNVNPAVITQNGATWNGMYNKSNGALSVDGFGLTLSSVTSSSSAVIELAGRVTQSPIALAQTGNFIEVRGQVYVSGISTFAVGLFNSGGVDPLVTRPVDSVALLNNGIANVSGQVATGGTTGWIGYRGMSLNNAVTADYRARGAQTALGGYASWELLTVGTGGFATPSAVNTTGQVASAAGVTVPWSTEGAVTPYDFVYRIQRSGADSLALSLTVTNHDTNTVVFASSASAASASAPSLFTSTFDAIAIGGRVISSPYIQVASLKVLASNADIVAITTQPVAQNIPLNGSSTLSVVASGTGPFTYQWYKDDVAIDTNGTSDTYAITNADSGLHGGNYRVVVRNAFGFETSATVPVSVSALAAPVVVEQPTNQNVDAGSPLTLTASVSGVPTPTYQWFRGVDEIPGAMSATYTVDSAALSDAGTYRLVASNSQGTIDSNTVTVTVNTAAPAITVPPSAVTVNVGQAINLSVTATGLPPPSYQWFLNDVEVPDATSSTYSIGSATTALAGNYKVVATNPFGTATSDPVVVTVNVVLPTITTQPPAALTVNSGERITLTAAYAGSAPLTYKWFNGETEIPNAIGASYTIAAASGADAGNYHVVVTNEGGFATSTDTVVSVVSPNESVIYSTDFSADTLNNPATPITANSTSYFVMANRAATNSSIGDNAATTEVVDPRFLLTWNSVSSSSVVETAARFSASPVSLTVPGEYIRMRATFKSTNLRVLGFGLYSSAGVSPVALDGSSGTSSLMTTAFSDAVGIGTQNWIGYRSSLTEGNTTGDVGTRPAQSSTTTNRGQDLVYPTNSTGAAFGEPGGVAIGIQPNLTSAATFTPNTTYTLVYTVALTANDQYTISYSLHAGATDTGAPLFTTNATSSAAAALPSAVTTSFDSLAIGLRNVDNTSNPTLTFTALSVVKSTPGTTSASAYETWASAALLTVGVNDGLSEDPDGDGINNLLEFVLDGDPLAASSSPLPVVQPSGANLTLTYKLTLSALADYDVVVQSSQDLVEWAPVVNGANGATIAQSPTSDPAVDQVVATVPISGTRTFLRVKVTPATVVD